MRAMDSKASAAAIKAIAAEYLKRVARPFLIGGSIVVIILIAVVLYLAYSVSSWWLIMLLLLVAPIVVLFIAFFTLDQLTKYLAPFLTKDQRKAVSGFVDTIQHTSEDLQIPPYIIAWRTFRTARNGQENYLRQVVHDSAKLKDDFTDVSKCFSA